MPKPVLAGSPHPTPSAEQALPAAARTSLGQGAVVG
jgi:hypothetical protein